MKIRNLNIRKGLISLALASSISFNLVGCNISSTKAFSSQDLYGEIMSSMNVDDYETFELEGDLVTTANLNFRTGPTTKFKIIKTLKKGTEAKVLGVTDNGWYKIEDDGKVGYVCGEYVTFHPLEKQNDEGEDISRYVYTTVYLNFRTGPSTDYKKIVTVPKGQALLYQDYLDNGWYMVKYNDKIGFVCGDYIDVRDEDYRDDFTKVAYATTDLNLRKEPNTKCDILYGISKNEAFEVLEEVGKWYKVRCNNTVGYVLASLTRDLSGVFVVVDIGDQTLTLYDGNKILLEVDITSGTKGSHDTPYGLFSIQSKTRDTYLTGPGYRSHVDYWMPFYYGYGIHDASWRNAFGGSYYVTNGSHGCVNVPPERTEEIYDAVEVGTKVLVHK